MQDRQRELLAIFDESLSKDETTLNLNNKWLKDQDITDLCDYLNTHPTIQTLDLSHNPITHLGMLTFAGRNETITHLNVSDCLLGDPGLEALGNNRTLTHVEARENAIGPMGAVNFARNNESITYLDVSKNFIFSIGAKALVANDALVTVVNEAMSKEDKSTDAANKVLAETHPSKKTEYARASGFRRDVPSLFNLSAHAVKEASEKDAEFKKKMEEKLTPAAKEGVKNIAPKTPGGKNS